MRTIRRWLPCLLLAAAATPAAAQFMPGAGNPYSRDFGGGSYSNNWIFIGRTNPWMPFVASVPIPNGRVVVPYNPAVPFVYYSPRYAGAPYGSGVSYTSGGTGSSYRPGPFAPPEPAPAAAAPRPNEAQRRAFDRWVADRDRARRPDAFGPEKSQELTVALNNPTPGDITGAGALNTILDALAAAPARLDGTPPVPLDETFLKRINFTRGAGSIGALRDGGRIAWPALLLGLPPAKETAELRRQVEARFADAFNQVNDGGKADPDNVKALLKSLDQLGDAATARAQAMTFADNLEVKRFLKGLEDAVTFLRQPDAAAWMPGKLNAKPATLQDLVRLMAEKGVHFAPALVGNDTAYLSLHRALADLYARAAPPQVGAKRP
jgi:hypothetical protein